MNDPILKKTKTHLNSLCFFDHHHVSSSGFQNTPYFIIRTHKETRKVKQHFLLGTKHATASFSDSVCLFIYELKAVMEGFPSSNMIGLKSGTADVLRQYGILLLCFFRLFIRQFSSLSLKRQNDVPCVILAWLLPDYFVIFLRKYMRSQKYSLLHKRWSKTERSRSGGHRGSGRKQKGI